MKLRNITLSQFLILEGEELEQYRFALMYAKETQPRDVLGFGDITKKSLGDVKDYQYLFTKEDAISRFIEKYGCESLKLLSVFDFFAFYRYVSEQVERVNTIENALLSHDPSPDEMEAGLDGFAKFSAIIQIDNLAGGDVLKYNAIRALVYEDALTKLALDKEKSDYQTRGILRVH